MKDIILNSILHFCLRHCYIDSLTARMVIHKLSKGEVQYYLDELEES